MEKRSTVRRKKPVVVKTIERTKPWATKPSTLKSSSSNQNLTKIPLDILLNAILVNEGVRPGMMIQPQDYTERSSSDPKTKAILTFVRKQFPNLKQSAAYDGYQGIIISKQNYNGTEVSSTKMGEILGYPCYAEFDDIDHDKSNYVIATVAHSESGQDITLIPNICKTLDNLNAFESLATKSMEAFKMQKYSSLLRDKIIRVDIKTENKVPTTELIIKLSTNALIDEGDKLAIANIAFNLGFSDKAEHVLELKDAIQYNNPLHRGLLLAMCLSERYDALSAFYPLQQYPGLDTEAREILVQWGEGFIKALKETQVR